MASLGQTFRKFLQTWSSAAGKVETLYQRRISCRPNFDINNGGPPIFTAILAIIYIIVHYTYKFKDDFQDLTDVARVVQFSNIPKDASSSSSASSPSIPSTVVEDILENWDENAAFNPVERKEAWRYFTYFWGSRNSLVRFTQF